MPLTPDDLFKLFAQFITLDTPGKKRAFLSEHPELLEDSTDSVLRQFEEIAENDGNLAGLRIIREMRTLFDSCRKVGIKTALDRLEESKESLEQTERIEVAYKACCSYWETSDRADLDVAIDACEWVRTDPHREVIPIDVRLFLLKNLALLLDKRFRVEGKPHDRDLAIETSREVVELSHVNDPEQPQLLASLALALEERFDRCGAPEDLDEAIKTYEAAWLVVAKADPNAVRYANNLAAAYQRRYNINQELSDLGRVVEIYEETVKQLPKDTPAKAQCLDALGTGLLDLYMRVGKEELLDRCVEAYDAALQHPALKERYRADVEGNLGNALGYRYQLGSDVLDLRQAIKVHRQSVEHAPPRSQTLANNLNNLSLSLRQLYLQDGKPEDLEEAITNVSNALQLSKEGPESAGKLNNLGTLLRDRYELLGKAEDLRRANEVHAASVEVSTEGSPELPSRLNNQGLGLILAYDRFGDPSDLEAAIRALESAVATTPDDAPDYAPRLSNFGLAMRRQFIRSGRSQDLEASVAAFEKAVQLIPETSPSFSVFFHNLGLGLLSRYALSGELGDLERARNTLERALQTTSPKAPELAELLRTVALAAWSRYRLSRQIPDLERSIELHEQALEILSSESPGALLHLTFLGSRLEERFARLGNKADLNRAIENCQKALDRVEPSSPDRPLFSSNLGACLLTRYRVDHDLADLEAAIKAFDRAAKDTPVEGASLATYLNGLGVALSERFKRRSNPKDLSWAVDAWRQACVRGLKGQTEVAQQAALNWGSHAAARHSWTEACEAYDYALAATYELFRVQLLRGHKEARLVASTGFAKEAARARLNVGDCEGAVVALERGRALLMSEVLERDRADLEHLTALGRGDLKDRYAEATCALAEFERAAEVRVLAISSLDEPAASSVDVLAKHQNARREFEDVVAEIRQISGYERFLLEPTFEDVKSALTMPGAYVGAGEEEGFALIVKPGGQVKSLVLPALDVSSLERRVRAYLKAYRMRRRQPSEWWNGLESVTRWLWEAVMQPILAAVQGEKRITLIPTGYLGLLPLHAAWVEDKTRPTGRRYALDDLTITYAPNARALSVAKVISDRVEPDALLAVEEPQPVTGPSLSNSHCEVQAAVSTFPQHKILAHEKALCEDVLKVVSQYPVFHFVCHGRADMGEPLSSGLVMAHDTCLSLRELLHLRLKGARLAVLSACETGIPGTELPDEVVSLPTGFLQAGVGSIVASLWSVADISTMILMTRFYELWRTEKLEPHEALREAQRWLRDTTDGEKQAHFEAFPLKFSNSGGGVPADVADALSKVLSSREPNARYFAHPYHWAAFGYTGF